MTSENNNINDILALHFAGERLTDEQENVLVDWVCKNKEEYRRLSDLFQTTDSTQQNIFRSDKAWIEVNKKLSSSKTFRFHKFRRVLSYAACIAVICGTALYFMNKSVNRGNLYCNTTASLLTVMLPDSSSVTLYPHAKISYLADENSNERKTELEGKAFFTVQPNAKKPFTVHSNKTDIRVLGTSFLVDGERKDETAIYVREGLVQVSSDMNKEILQADEQALSDGDKIVKSNIEHPEVVFNNHIKQKNYQNTPISLVVRDLEKEFRILVTCPDDLTDAKISTRLRFTNLDEVLSEISYICNVKYRKISDKEFELYKP